MNDEMRDKDVEAARVAISIEPHIARNHYHLGNLLTIAGQLKDAEAAQLNAIELDHSRPEYHTALSRVLHRLGRRADAIEAARKAAEIGQDNALYHRNLGKMFADAGQIDEARRAQQRAVELGCETLGFCNERDDNGFRIFGPSHTINLPILDPKTLTILRIVLAWFGSQWWADEFKRLLLNDDRQSEGELLWPLGKALPAIQQQTRLKPHAKQPKSGRIMRSITATWAKCSLTPDKLTKPGGLNKGLWNWDAKHWGSATSATIMGFGFLAPPILSICPFWIPKL